MVPEDIVLQLKRNGTFDDLRKKLLAGFQNGTQGKEFVDRLTGLMEEMVNSDPTILNSSAAYEQITKQIEKADIYQSLRQQVLESLQKDDYKTRITEQIDSISKDNE
ncbi:hypothetical protein G6F37_010776 [Rhizopus arrhizus]|nr:hypothetical protein G6F38_001520 [Rhizopus arrhizus]KAG1152604.1 hypothetical protein G6F37_010776 [Rhizopus arrhizus]